MGDRTQTTTQEYDYQGPTWGLSRLKNLAGPQFGDPIYGETITRTLGQGLGYGGGPEYSYTPVTGYDYSMYGIQDPSQYLLSSPELLRSMYSDIQPTDLSMPGTITAGQMAAPGQISYETEGDVRRYLEQAAQYATGRTPLGGATSNLLMNLIQGGGMNPYEAGSPYQQYSQSALSDFQRNIAPQIAEQMAGQGALRSSAAREATEQATLGFGNQLQQQAYQQYLLNQQRQMQAAGMAQQQGAQQASQLLGVAGGYGQLGGQLAGIQGQNIANQMQQQQFNIQSSMRAQEQNIANLMAQGQFNAAQQMQAQLANMQAALQSGQFDIANQMAIEAQNAATQLGIEQYNLEMPLQVQQMDWQNQLNAILAAQGGYQPTEQTTTQPFNFVNDILGPVLGGFGSIAGGLIGGG